MAPSDNLFYKVQAKIRLVKNEMSNTPNSMKACEIAALFFEMVLGCCTWQAPSPKCITVSL